MPKRNLPYLILGIIILTVGLAGCELPRAGTEGDIAQSVPEIATSTGAGDQFAPPDAAQAENAIVRLQPATQQVRLDDLVPVEIRISNVANLVGADVEVRFNPAILRVQDADPNQEGIQIEAGDFLQADFVVANEVDNNSGDIRYIVTQVGNIPPAQGEGRLASMIFEAINDGVSDLTFRVAKLASNTGDPIPATTETSQITVGEEGAGEPTIEPTEGPTVEPTAGPTIEPTAGPTIEPTPTVEPTPLPTATPTTTPIIIAPPAPTATTPPLAKIPPGATIGFCYRVRPGEENIYFLAKKFGATPYGINLANDLHPPNYIFTHQILFMPEELGHGPNVYRIRAGDTLTSIAAECHLKVSMIVRRNYLDPEIDPDAPLPEDEALKIPIPYFPPPSRFEYPKGPIPVVPLPPPCCR